MFNKSGKRGNIRKRTAEEEEEEEGSAVVQKKKSIGPTGPLGATTVNKEKKKESDLAFSFESARTAVPTIGHDSRALAGVDDEGIDGPVPAQRGAPAASHQQQQDSDKKVYTGAANYQKLVEKRDVMDRKASAIGPIRAPTNVRITARFDYQPDLCKDYKETGYCTFGDACKFMHDRGDYKSGWELDRDWKLKEDKDKMDALQAELEGDKKEEEEEDDGLPFACSLCRGPFKSPVETRCHHYFCESCALAHYKTSRRCVLCNEQTFGQFNTAHKLVAKLQRFELRRKRLEAGDEEEEEPASKDGGEGGGGGAGAGGVGGSGVCKFVSSTGWAIPGNTFQTGKEF